MHVEVGGAAEESHLQFQGSQLGSVSALESVCWWAKENGMDVCHLTLSLVDAFLSGVESPELRLPKQNITIQMQNKFLYQVRIRTGAS